MEGSGRDDPRFTIEFSDERYDYEDENGLIQSVASSRSGWSSSRMPTTTATGCVNIGEALVVEARSWG